MASVIGVSRSGRVRKKSTKLMEMEDSFGDDAESPQIKGRKSNTPSSQLNLSGGNNSGTIHISYIPQTPRDKGASFLNPRSKHQGSAQNSTNLKRQLPSVKLNTKVSRKKSGDLNVSIKKRKKEPTISLESEKEVNSSPDEEKEERVIAIKQLSPTFDTLSGSAYLMGEDLHFITGEPVASNDEESLDSNNDNSVPLKVDVGYADEPSVSVSEESGLKMKFILSPKTGIKNSKSDKSKFGSKRKKSSKSKKSSGHGTSKSKVKKKSHSSVEIEDDAALDLLADENVPDNDDSNIDETLSDEIDEDFMGSAKLVIAEPRPSEPKSKKKKKKKSSNKEDGVTNSNSRRSSGKKSKSKTSIADKEPDIPSLEETAELAPILPQSLYFKEKNSTKKKINKKAIAKPKEKTEKKQRLISAYMLWSQEYRKIVVSENPGFDFAQISRRLGELWQSYPEKEKMQWRSKAKIKSGKLAISNLINTSKKVPVEFSERTRPPILKPVIQPAKPDDNLPLSPRDVNKVVGTSALDVAAHLKLLGESLGTIGQRLTQHEGQIAVSGSLSVLLDSILCAIGPLVCLTSEIDQLNGCSKEVHQKILDNIAYIMPGL